MLAVLAHERLFPVILLLGNILAGTDVWGRLVAEHIIAVLIGVAIVTSVIIHHIGRKRRQDDTAVIGLEKIKNLGDTVGLEPQEDGRCNLYDVIALHLR